MSGSQYVALSALKTRLDELDQLAGDLANAGTSGYKGLRASHATADVPSFDDDLHTAMYATAGPTKLDMTPGTIAPTGRTLDVAIEGSGFFSLQTPNGTRYTRDGHFSRASDGTLVTQGGATVLGKGGSPIKLGSGEVKIDNDGTVWTGTTKAGQIGVSTFDDPGGLVRESDSTLRADGGATPTPVATPTLQSGALEESNVSLAERMAELTELSRSFDALQRSISLTLNDVDGKAIEVLGRQ